MYAPGWIYGPFILPRIPKDGILYKEGTLTSTCVITGAALPIHCLPLKVLSMADGEDGFALPSEINATSLFCSLISIIYRKSYRWSSRLLKYGYICHLT